LCRGRRKGRPRVTIHAFPALGSPEILDKHESKPRRHRFRPQQPAPQRAGIQSVEVGFSLLEVLSTSPGPLMLRDLAAAAGMSAAKAHRYLVSFQRLELVAQDSATTRYDLGPAALKLGLAALSRLDSVKLARQLMPSLMAQTGQTLALAVWGNQGPTLVHWEESPQAVTVNLRLGDVLPLLSSATGLCFTAFSFPRLAAGAKSAAKPAGAAGERRAGTQPEAGAQGRSRQHGRSRRLARRGAPAGHGPRRQYLASRRGRLLRTGV
jgi:DNA-binding IclR family transcriptional regulator